jgi:phosphohistidine phosphatase
MKLLLVRHAIAEDRLDWAQKSGDDDLRPLTERGRRRMKQGARGLRILLDELDAILTSPLIRAVQTADVLGEVYTRAEVQVLEPLRPGSLPERVAERLAAFAGDAVVALVGHEPDLGELASWLLSGRDVPFLVFKKGGACLLETNGPPRPGVADLLWHATPRQLRKLC